MQVDLHIHSTASDGTWTPPEVVAAALAAGLGAIAVTDHDSVANVAATRELAVAAGLKFIPGAEICSTKDDFCFHILGYGIDVTNKRLLDLLEHNERLLNSKDDESIKMLIERGWPLDFEEFLQLFNINDKVYGLLKSAYEGRSAVDEMIHNKMLQIFNLYLIIGGMPAAVEKYRQTEQIDAVIDEHESILEQYKLDFTQYEAENKKLLLTNIYELIPAELNEKNKRFKFADLDKGFRFERMEDSFS